MSRRSTCSDLTMYYLICCIVERCRTAAPFLMIKVASCVDYTCRSAVKRSVSPLPLPSSTANKIIVAAAAIAWMGDAGYPGWMRQQHCQTTAGSRKHWAHMHAKDGRAVFSTVAGIDWCWIILVCNAVPQALLAVLVERYSLHEPDVTDHLLVTHCSRQQHLKHCVGLRVLGLHLCPPSPSPAPPSRAPR